VYHVSNFDQALSIAAIHTCHVYLQMLCCYYFYYHDGIRCLDCDKFNWLYPALFHTCDKLDFL